MKLLLAILFQLTLFAANAQQGFTFVRFSAEDGNGLAGNIVYSVYQDAKGFIWTGTANGLQRFDGSKFIHVQSRRSSMPLLYTAIYQMLPLSKKLLALNYGDKIGIFDTETYEYRQPSIPEAAIKKATGKIKLWKDEKAALHLLIPGYGLLKYDENKMIFIPADFKLSQPAAESIRDVFTDTLQQRLWFAGSKGLFVYDSKTGACWSKTNHPSSFPLPGSKLGEKNMEQVFIDRKRRIWLIEDNNGQQLQHCVDSNAVPLLADTAGINVPGKRGLRYNHFFESPRTGFWIYGKGLLMNWDKYTKRFHFNPSSERATVNTIEYDVINDLAEDRDGNVWIATNKGLYFTSFGSGSFSIVNYLVDETISRHNITGIIQMPNEDFWLSTYGSGVICIDRHLVPQPIPFYKTAMPGQWSASARKAVKYCRSICLERKTGKVWAGCDEGLVVCYDPATQQSEYLQVKEANGSAINIISEDAAGNLWLGSASGRLLKWNGVSFGIVTDVKAAIVKVFHDRKGGVWVATQNQGIYLLDAVTGRVVKHFTESTGPQGLASNIGSDIEQLSDSIIVCSGGGLNLINRYNFSVKKISYADGLPSNEVYRLRADSSGKLWVITANGLCRYDPQQNRITSYGRKDGVTLAASTTAADIMSGNGLLIFTGNNAIIMFKPFIFSNHQPPPNVAITGFKLFNEDMPVDSLLQLDKIKLAPGQNSFTIYYSSMSFQQQNRLLYYYKMEGIDKEWNVATDGHFQNYPLLPPGEYTFKVYAENVEGQQSAQVTELKIFIKAPFWETGWFYALVALCIAAILYGLHRLKVNRLMAVEKIRSRVARDLHDDMGSALSTINILSSMAKSKMEDDNVKAAQYLGKISENSQQMMDAMDDIVWSIKPDNDSMQKMIARIRAVATDLLEPKNIVPVFAINEQVYEVKLDMEQRRDCFLFIKEAINNAAKYSKAEEVIISMQTDKRFLYSIIKDDGAGFDPGKADTGNGLGNMKKRADSLRATFRLVSAPGKGTSIELDVPLQ